MHLKRLELTGFKSFADKIYLDLGTGLNAVVGPNGSGKSNIADALRWVLGEQSAKQLRGGKMEDIIFNGTAHRKPLGYAEIVMRLDNSLGTLPLEFKEISVTRRVYRSGESEFAINGTPCRLKDIQMLFMDTGIGRDGYSIVGQGRIDEILSLKSEDRRLVFEEAAGIGKFKSRRNEATNKLNAERQNRERVNDIITELEEQLDPLQEQSEEARKYLALRDQYKDVHLNIFISDIDRIEVELKQVDEALKNGVEESTSGKQLLTEARSAGESLKIKASEADRRYRVANDNLLETTTAIEKKESDGKLLENQKEQHETEQQRLKTEVEKREQQLKQKDEEHKKEDENKKTAQQELNDLNKELNQQQEKAQQRDEALRESSLTLTTLNENVMGAMTALTEAQSAVLEAENAYNRLEDDKERINIEIEHHETRVDEQAALIQQLEESSKTCQHDLNNAKTSQEAYTNAHDRLIEESKELDSKIRDVQETLTATRGRYRALSDLENQQEGYFRSVKAVLRKKASKDPLFSGICGAVGELIGVNKNYETAIETALGGAAQNIITQSEEDAKTAIEMLKQTKEGRATFLPLSSVKGKVIDGLQYKKEQGFIDVASALINCDDIYKPIIAQLLGDALVMDNMDNALALHKKHRHLKIVTISGERLSPGGALTGGTTTRTGASIIGRSRNVQALKQQVETLEKELETITNKETELTAKRNTTEETLEGAKEKTQALQLELQLQLDKLSTAKEVLQALEEQTERYNEENEYLMASLVESNGVIRAAKTDLKNQEENVNNARNNLENYQNQMEQNRQEHSEEADTLTELRVEISRRDEWINQSEANINRILKEKDVLTTEKRQLINDIEASVKAASKAENDKKYVAEALVSLKSRLNEIKNEQASAEKEKLLLDKAISHAEEDERTHSDSTALLEKEITRLEMRKEHLDATSLRLHNEIWEEYSLTYQKALTHKRIDIAEPALRKEMSDLKAQLSQLSDVNIGSIEAYKQLRTRYEFLTAQRDDILTAEESLNELIESLTLQMEEQFSEQFKLIAMHFGDVFKQMFGGGKADLRLVDMENILESGIEITAQPPGKALQNLMLLSGGERALTAIALLFAILRLKPSPFCVLDEIESALDDANVVRFANFMREYSKGTQFIVITHRKGTMEAADRLYGVTMEEQGISKLVSVSFVDADTTTHK